MPLPCSCSGFRSRTKLLEPQGPRERRENHGLSRPTNQKDYAVRMLEWFGHYLKGEPAPEWMQEGVPRLRMEEHLRERKALVDPKAKVAEKKVAM